jgi:ADP-dependent NAD(P)H-hydrate dehydratase / NAD(P)H-hydrate epimerase
MSGHPDSEAGIDRVVNKINDHILIGPKLMGMVDRDAADSSISGSRLMQNAGEAIAALALKSYPQAMRFLVLCGPGNNGGDGYVAASALCRAGAQTEVFALGESGLKGDAKAARDLWSSAVGDLDEFSPRQGDVVIDAIFGAGLNKDVPLQVADAVKKVTLQDLPVIAADVPSGIDGETGEVRGCAFRAAHTVTFMCRKPGHLLLPGRDYCGHVSVADIGIPQRLVLARASGLTENAPCAWMDVFPHLHSASHKYSRGHLAVFSGGSNSTGAARLSAAAALKAGTGAVTLVSPQDALAVNAAHLTAVMLKERTGETIDWLLSDDRISAFVIGPGFGVSEDLRSLVLELAGKQIVLDADAITAFAKDPEPLFAALRGAKPGAILTPHDGEFRRLFPDIAGQSVSKVEKALQAAGRANAVVIYKGADTVVASPDGRAAINTNAPPWLATAGSGDVLAGIAGALLAQDMPVFEAACAAAFMHGAAGTIAGRGLTAETLVDAIPAALP